MIHELTAAEQVERRLTVLEEFSKAWTARDVDALMSHMADDCEYLASVGAGPGTDYRGCAEVRAGFETMLAHDMGRARHAERAIVCGDRAIGFWSFEYEEEGGERMTIRGVDIFEFEGALIKSKDAYRKVRSDGGKP